MRSLNLICGQRFPSWAGCLHDDELPTFLFFSSFFFIASDSHGIPRLLFLTLHRKGICTTLVRFSSRHEHEIMGFLNDDGDIKLMGYE